MKMIAHLEKPIFDNCFSVVVVWANSSEHEAVHSQLYISNPDRSFTGFQQFFEVDTGECTCETCKYDEN